MKMFIRKKITRCKVSGTFLAFFITFTTFLKIAVAFPDPGQWSATFLNADIALFGTHKSLYAGSSIHIAVNCDSVSPHHQIKLQWVIRQTSCYEDYLSSDIYASEVLKQYFMCPMTISTSSKIRYFKSDPVVLECSNRIHLNPVNATLQTYSEKSDPFPGCKSIYTQRPDEDISVFPNISASNSLPQENVTSNSEIKVKSLIQENDVLYNSSGIATKSLHRQKKYVSNQEETSKHQETFAYSFKDRSNGVFHENAMIYFYGPGYYSTKLGPKLTSVDMDGVYLFILKIENLAQTTFNATVDAALKGDHGYLSAIDYPLLIFYGVMCGLYVIYAIVWLILCALQWRDLLRIQFWIGGVILLGLMEKAVFYAEYQSINYTGQSVQGAILFAEILSSMKRTLARMLIIVVSLGFGIVKPRLGPTLHRIVGVGFIYFVFSAVEGSLRVLKPKTDPSNQALMAGIPLAITDSIICWWIFSSLVQTLRTLQLRRNIVKLQLYRHFTNILILSVLGSVAFMTWSIHAHKLVNCIANWKELWVDEAYWHFLFSAILFVIMILWRPTNNNQRYAFTPLLDAIDEDDDEEDNLVSNDVFVGMKMRSSRSSNNSPKHDESKSKPDEDLKWVEENIPPSLTDVALPSLLDSDEEIMTARFERSKME